MRLVTIEDKCSTDRMRCYKTFLTRREANTVINFFEHTYAQVSQRDLNGMSEKGKNILRI